MTARHAYPPPSIGRHVNPGAIVTITLDTVRHNIPARAQEALSRASRQALQALVPTLVVVAGGTASGIHVLGVAELGLVAAVISLLKSAASLKLSPSSPSWEQIAERMATAAAGTALGFVTVDGTIAATSIPWETTFTASLGAAGVALVMWYLNPPVVARGTSTDGAPADDPEPTGSGSIYRQPTDGDIFG